MTVAQAVVEYLSKQYTVDSIGGVEYRERLIPGTFGIFGHGNVAGVGQALKQYQAADPSIMPYYQGRNEQAQVHQAVGYARHTRRRQTFAISTSIGPGSTNLLTGAALATTNRLPVLLLPSDTFATRAADPVLQQLEQPYAYDLTVNDAFRPLSKFFDRVSRPEQLFSAFHHGLRVLTDPAETGAVTISLPQDVQAEAFDVPEEFLAEREWRIRRPEADDEDIARAAEAIRAAKRPLIIAGGGVLYAYANEELAKFAELTGIPVGNTQAGVGVLPWDHPFSLGAIGSTGTTAANAIAADADLIIGIGTRYEDFTTASRTAFQNPDVRFININVAAIDAYTAGITGAANSMFVIVVDGNTDLHVGCSDVSPQGVQRWPQPAYNIGTLTSRTTLLTVQTPRVFSAGADFTTGSDLEIDREMPSLTGGVAPPIAKPRRVGVLDDILFFVAMLPVATDPLGQHPYLAQGIRRGDRFEVTPLADDVEDLQIAYGVDTNNDNAITRSTPPNPPFDPDPNFSTVAGDDEWRPNTQPVGSETPFTETDFQSQNPYVDGHPGVPPAAHCPRLHGVMVSLLAKAHDPDPTYKGPAASGYVLMDVPLASGVPTTAVPGNYRRRVQTLRINLRNYSFQG
jgi:hypothetical protein